MSITTSVNTAVQLIAKTDLTKIFLGGNETIQMSYTNSTGAAKTITAGLVMGRISASALALPLESDASDGSQYPVGVLMNETITVANGATATITVAICGDINENELTFENGTDTLATAVSSKILRDRIAADTLGIRLVAQTENTRFDNE